jgi:citronellol/citronellal dehydrogenase
MADAAHEVLCSDARKMTGRFLLDEDVLRNAGVRDFDAYNMRPERR